MTRDRADQPQLEIALLGPVEVRLGGELVSLAGERERALLAVLALRANESRPLDSLVNDLWGDDPPPTASKMIQIVVSHLRQKLAPIGSTEAMLVTSGGGYQLRIEPDCVDALRFERIIRGADADRAAGLDVGDTYGAALSLWRGDALADIRDAPFAGAASARLEEQRIHAFECWIDEQHQAGRHAETISEIRAMVVREPLRELLRAQLMLALYRSGRQAEALQTFVDFRRQLNDELGIEPGPELQALQNAILNHDASIRAIGIPGKVSAGAGSSLEDESPRESQPIVADAGRRSVPALPAALAVVVVFVLLASWAAASASGGAHQSASTLPTVVAADSVAVVDTSTARVVADVPLGGAPSLLLTDSSSVWVGNIADHTLAQVDRGARTLVRTIGLPAAPTAMAEGDGILWIGNGFLGTLSRFVISFNQQTGPFYPAEPQTGLLTLTTGPGVLWVGLPDNNLIRVDPLSVQPTTIAPLEVRPRLLLSAFDSLWVTGYDTPELSRVNTKDLTDTGRVSLPGEAVAIAADSNDLFVVTTAPNELVQIDPQTLSLGAEIALKNGATGLAVSSGTAWLLEDNGLLETIDLGSAAVSTHDIGRPVSAIALEQGEVWATTR